jgi:cytochrome c551/c552
MRDERNQISSRWRRNAALLRFCKLVAVFGLGLILVNATGLDIQLPPETGAFKQDSGAEIANGQCLICHSVEYVTMQPPMPRAFWKSSVQKMQQKYGAPIPEEQVETVVAYLTRNYGVTTNGAAAPAVVPGDSKPVPATAVDGPQLATRYGCFGCHNPTLKIVGPAYRDIASKYKSDPEAFAKIDQQIHQGGSGKWGPIIMPPFPQISASETKVLANWILGAR